MAAQGGQPRQDPARNDARRESEEIGKKIENGPLEEAPANWEHLGSLVGGPQGPLVGRGAKRRDRDLPP